MHLIIANKKYSSWSFRPWLLMKMAGIRFKETVIFLGSKTTKAAIGKFSPGGRVPVLIDGNVKVWESLAICEYLAEKYPGKNLWPKDRKARAEARAVSNEMHAGFTALRQSMTCHFFARYQDFPVTPETQADIDRILEIWNECRGKYGKGGPFLFGKFTIADAMYAPVVYRFLTYDVKVDNVSRAYMETIESLPASREWVSAAKKEKAAVAAYENRGKKKSF